MSQHFEKQCDVPDVTLPAQGRVIDGFESPNSIHSTTKTTEIELKLLCDPERLADIASAPVVVQYSRDIETGVDLRATYFDTPESALRAAGYVLRIRTDGEQHVMTLKSQDLARDTAPQIAKAREVKIGQGACLNSEGVETWSRLQGALSGEAARAADHAEEIALRYGLLLAVVGKE